MHSQSSRDPQRCYFSDSASPHCMVSEAGFYKSCGVQAFCSGICVAAALLGRHRAPTSIAADNKPNAMATRSPSSLAPEGYGRARRRTTAAGQQEVIEKMAALAAAAASATATHSRELLSSGTETRIKWQRKQRAYSGGSPYHVKRKGLDCCSRSDCKLQNARALSRRDMERGRAAGSASQSPQQVPASLCSV